MKAEPGPGGLIIVDKPAGLTSHDVVARLRRIAGTRRVGHAGTLDPMATGVLVIGVDRATRLLGHLALTTKAYIATIRLGASTVTDDAEGELTDVTAASGIPIAEVRRSIARFSGPIDQVPSAVSAVKIDGKRSYARVRAGEDVVLAPRRVVVERFDVLEARPVADFLDLDVLVECSSGTYIRALARDVGLELGVGGHLTALRRTRVGPFDLAQARTLEELGAAHDPVSLRLSVAVGLSFPRRDVGADDAVTLGHGGRLAGTGEPGPYGVFGPDGEVIALMAETDGVARPVVVLRPAT
jgi:tRNA pseudouridine55 synthase